MRTKNATTATPPHPGIHPGITASTGPLFAFEQDAERRGPGAVQHSDTRGRRSTTYPDLNIGATARLLGVTKGHLAKVLAGENRPSIKLALKISVALGISLTDVIALYKMEESQETKTKPKQKRAVDSTRRRKKKQ